jgi:transcription initiation factor TFIIH subunit 4
MEKNRLRSSIGVLYQDFPRDQDYREVLNQAEDFGYVLWKSDAQKRLVLSADGHEHVRNWLKEKQKRLNQ